MERYESKYEFKRIHLERVCCGWEEWLSFMKQMHCPDTIDWHCQDRVCKWYTKRDMLTFYQLHAAITNECETSMRRNIIPRTRSIIEIKFTQQNNNDACSRTTLELYCSLYAVHAWLWMRKLIVEHDGKRGHMWLTTVHFTRCNVSTAMLIRMRSEHAVTEIMIWGLNAWHSCLPSTVHPLILTLDVCNDLQIWDVNQCETAKNRWFQSVTRFSDKYDH